MDNHLLAQLNPELLGANSIETLNDLKKEDFKALHEAYRNQMKARPYLRVELFKNNRSQGKMNMNYNTLAGRLFNGYSDSFNIYGIIGRNESKIIEQVVPIEKAKPIKTAFTEESNTEINEEEFDNGLPFDTASNDQEEITETLEVSSNADRQDDSNVEEAENEEEIKPQPRKRGRQPNKK